MVRRFRSALSRVHPGSFASDAVAQPCCSPYRPRLDHSSTPGLCALLTTALTGSFQPPLRSMCDPERLSTG